MTELKNKSKSELNELLLSLLEEQFQLRLRGSAAEAPKSHLYGVVRKKIARVKTALNQAD